MSARLGRTHDRILEAYAQIDAGTPADAALSLVFEKARDLGRRERAEVSNAIYALIRKKRLIDDVLERAAKAEKRRFSDLDKPVAVRLRLLALWALEGMSLDEILARDEYAAKRIPRAFERITSGKLPKAKRSALEELAITLSLPTFIVEKLARAFGEDRTRMIGEALSTRAPVTLRVNRLKATREELAARIEREHALETAPGRLSPDALILPHSVDLPSWPLFGEGWCELQDEGSQLVALATGARSGDRILDACAGTGGKSLTIAAIGATVRAIDVDRRKIDQLAKRAERAGVRIDAKAMDFVELSEREAFDCVLVDAPCSGTGALRRAPDSVWRLDEADLEKHMHRQRHFLTTALTALKTGGRLVYATCSVLREENEAIAEYLLEQRTVDPLPLSELWGEALSAKLAATHHARIGPGPTDRDPDGFYVATFRKR
jgi:16S rRNA (cytosine967-C5)-methyltransferase